MATTATQPQPMILRVVEPDWTHKLKLSSRPASVVALIQIIKEQLQLDLDFSLEYEDPDFNGCRIELVQIEELPQKAVVHIVSQGSSTASTEILSDVSFPERAEGWPTGLQYKFVFDVELVQNMRKLERSST